MLTRRFGPASALTGAAIALCSFALAGCGNADKAEIEKSYAGIDQAMNAKDAAKFTSFYSDKFSAKAPNGQTATKAMLQQGLGAAFNMAQSIDSKTTVEDVSVSGETATAKIKQHVTIKINNPLTGKPADVVTDATKSDTWAKEGGAWKLTATQTSSSNTTVDGKTMNLPGMGAL
jgi:ketosteroid isomerase-like protein